jgi:hypothetical protein
MNLNAHAERLIYRIAGLPVAVSALWASTADGSSDVLQSAFVWRY